jgi:hypothetical protein
MREHKVVRLHQEIALSKLPVKVTVGYMTSTPCSIHQEPMPVHLDSIPSVLSFGSAADHISKAV